VEKVVFFVAIFEEFGNDDLSDFLGLEEERTLPGFGGDEIGPAWLGSVG
jgi:hypothetical protein